MLRLRSRGQSSVGFGAAVVMAVWWGASGCGSSTAQSSGSTATSGAGMTSAVDRTRCDDKGKQVVTSDTNGDRRADIIKLYKTGADGTQALVCKQVDLNNDGKIDIVYHYDDNGGPVTFEEFDLDFDGRFDLRAFYQGGRKVREEMDTNYDNRVDFTKYYENDKLVRIERDSNNDGRVDEWQYYDNGKLDRIGYDSTGSGRVDRWERAPDEAAGVAEPTAAAPAAPAAGTPPSPGPVPPASAGPAAPPTTPAR